MGSIVNRDGRWRAQVRRVGHRDQCKTFATKAQAERWVRQVEADIESGNSGGMLGTLTIGDFLKAYRGLRDKARPISDQSNEHYMLKALERGLGHVRIAVATPDHLVTYAKMRKDEGAGPYTINMDVSKLGTAMRFGGAALKVTPPDLVGASRPLLTHLRLIGGGGKRERRPTEDEMTAVLAHLRTEYGLIYAEAVAFSAVSAMRRGEVCAILRSDIDVAKRCVGVWRKHPRLGKKWHIVPLIGESWNIVQRQPVSEDGRVFPIHDRTLSKYFTETCKALSIPDLHLHDMRHEGTSKLFEEGYLIQQVALVTGHADWKHLKRYTQLRPEDLTRRARERDQDALPRPGNPPTDGDPPGTS